MQFLKKAPILRLVIPYFLGIIPSLFLGINTNPVSSFGLVLFLGLCVVFLGIFQLKTNQRLYHSLFGGLLLLFFFFLGVYRWNSTRLENQANFFIPNNAEQIAIKITDKQTVNLRVCTGRRLALAVLLRVCFGTAPLTKIWLSPPA